VIVVAVVAVIDTVVCVAIVVIGIVLMVVVMLQSTGRRQQHQATTQLWQQWLRRLWQALATSVSDRDTAIHKLFQNLQSTGRR